MVHITHTLATAGAVLADIGAFSAGVLVMRGPEQHEMGRRPADLRASQHQAQVLRLSVLAAGGKTVVRGHAKAGLIAAQALVDAGLHVVADLVHRLTRVLLGSSDQPATSNEPARADQTCHEANIPAAGTVPAFRPRLSGSGFGQEDAPELMWPTLCYSDGISGSRCPVVVRIRKGGSLVACALCVMVQVISAVRSRYTRAAHHWQPLVRAGF
jgi:hypothetical protein